MQTFIPMMQTDLIWYCVLRERVVADCQIDQYNASQQRTSMSVWGVDASSNITMEMVTGVVGIGVADLLIQGASGVRSASGLSEQFGARVLVRDGPELVIQFVFVIG